MKNEQQFKPDKALFEGARQIDNVTLVYVRTTEDKLRHYIRDFKEAHLLAARWSIPAGFVVSFFLAGMTTEFVDRWSLKKEHLQAIFFVAFGASIIWFAIACVLAFRCRNRNSVDYLIRQIKNNQD